MSTERRLSEEDEKRIRRLVVNPEMVLGRRVAVALLDAITALREELREARSKLDALLQNSAPRSDFEALKTHLATSERLRTAIAEAALKLIESAEGK